MNTLPTKQNWESIWQKAALGLALLITVTTALAIYGYFRGETIFLAALTYLIGLIVLILINWLRKRKFSFKCRDTLIILLIIFIVLLNGYFHHDLPQGRDNMGYLSASIKLAESGSLEFSDIISRTYHPFRNLGDDIFTSQFLPGYNSYLAILYQLFGLTGIFWANSLLFLFTLLAVYFLGKKLIDWRTGLLAVILIVTYYTSLWFTRRTLSENLFMFLVWIGLWFLTSGIKDKKPFWLGAGLFSFSVLPLVRTEGLIFLAFYFFLLIYILLRYFRQQASNFVWPGLATLFSSGSLYLFYEYGQKYGQVYLEYGFRAVTSFLNFAVQSGLLWICLAIIAFLFFAVYYGKKIFVKVNKQINIRKVLLAVLFLGFLAWVIYSQNRFYQEQFFKWSEYKMHYVLENFWFYLLVPYLLAVYWGLVKNVYNKYILFIILAVLPSFVFLIEPSIAVDQPWFMRRFFPVIIPLTIFLASITLTKIVNQKKSLYYLGLVFLAINLSISLPIAFFKEYNGVQPQLQELTDQIGQNDLLVMDPGWHWQQWGYALHYVYDVAALPNLDNFTENDFLGLAKNYDQVYVLSQKNENIHPNYIDENLVREGEWNLTYPYLERTSWMASYVDENAKNLDWKVIKENQEGTPPSVVKEVDQTFNLYRVIDKNLIIWP